MILLENVICHQCISFPHLHTQGQHTDSLSLPTQELGQMYHYVPLIMEWMGPEPPSLDDIYSDGLVLACIYSFSLVKVRACYLLNQGNLSLKSFQESFILQYTQCQIDETR